MQNTTQLQSACLTLFLSGCSLFTETFKCHNIKTQQDIYNLYMDTIPGLISLASNLVTDLDNECNTNNNDAYNTYKSEYHILDTVHHNNPNPMTLTPEQIQNIKPENPTEQSILTDIQNCTHTTNFYLAISEDIRDSPEDYDYTTNDLELFIIKYS